MSAFEPGDIINGRYEITPLSNLGDPSRLVDVYVALQKVFGRTVLMRIARLQRTERQTLRVFKAFEAEFEVRRQVKHKTLPELIDFGRIESDEPKHLRRPFIVQQQMTGRLLRAVLDDEGPITPRRTVVLMTQCLEGLARLHALGMCHRGLWPDNLVVLKLHGEQEALGVSSFVTVLRPDPEDPGATVFGIQGIVPARYQAPEEHNGKTLTPAVDVYQMGLVLVEMLTGKPAIVSDDYGQCMLAHLRIGGQSPQIPDWLKASPLGAVIDKALTVDDSQRYPDAGALRRALLSLNLEGIEVPIIQAEVEHTEAPSKVVLKGRFELGEEVGEGAHGKVLSARDLETDRAVAVKIMKWPEVLDLRDAFLKRFEQESDILIKLSDHQNIADLVAAGQMPAPDKRPYMIQEMLKGHSLDEELVSNGPLNVARALKLFSGALSALCVAHRHAPVIVHKDLKPSNLFIVNPGTSNERLTVIDFGVARVGGPQTALTCLDDKGLGMGSPAYMAPEYLRTKEVSPAVDVYQMGLVLAESLTGRRVIEGEVTFCLYQHVMGEAFGNLSPSLKTSPLGPILNKALAAEPTARYTDAGLMLEALAGVDPAEVVLDKSEMAWPEGSSPTLTGQPPAEALEAIEALAAFRDGLVGVASLGSMCARFGPLPDDHPQWLQLKEAWLALGLHLEALRPQD